MILKLNVNSINYSIDVDPSKRLLDVIREDLKLIGTKEGCSDGECGACTIIVNGKAINYCMVLAIQARDLFCKRIGYYSMPICTFICFFFMHLFYNLNSRRKRDYTKILDNFSLR